MVLFAYKSYYESGWHSTLKDVFNGEISLWKNNLYVIFHLAFSGISIGGAVQKIGSHVSKLSGSGSQSPDELQNNLACVSPFSNPCPALHS